MSGWKITAPFLSDQDRAKAVAAGGLSDGQNPTSSAKGLLLGLQRHGHIYAGTVPPEVVAKRRRKNRQAKLSRLVNRGRK